MTTPGFDYPLPVEYKIPGICEPPIQTEVCFTRRLDSDLWDDAAGFAGVGVNVCLRAKITTPDTFDPWSYDDDKDGEISKVEALNAVVDYFDGVITKDQAIEVLWLYFA
jgi:hypothetical protein